MLKIVYQLSYIIHSCTYKNHAWTVTLTLDFLLFVKNCEFLTQHQCNTLPRSQVFFSPIFHPFLLMSLLALRAHNYRNIVRSFLTELL